MTDIKLVRTSENSFGTFGILSIEYPHYQPIAVAMELKWKDNKRNISCIPPGTYELFKRMKGKKKFVYEFKNVPYRTYIQIHVGNYPADSKGCILVGEKFNFIKNKPVLLESTHAFNEMSYFLKDKKSISIEIVDATRL